MDISKLAIRLQYLYNKILDVSKNKGKFGIIGEDGLIGVLEYLDEVLTRLDIAPHVRLDIQTQIRYFNITYIDTPTKRLYLDTSDINFINIKNWIEDISTALYNSFYIYKIDTASIDKNKLRLGLNSFLDEDTIKFTNKNAYTLDQAISCILLGMPAGAMIYVLRVYGNAIRYIYTETGHELGQKKLHYIIEELFRIEYINENFGSYLKDANIKYDEIEYKEFSQYECEETFLQVIGLIKKIKRSIKEIESIRMDKTKKKIGEIHLLDLPVEYDVKNITINDINNNTVKIAAIQFCYELMTNSFPPMLKNEDKCIEKINRVLDKAKDEMVNIACLPELCMNEKWVSLIKQRYPDMIIIGGTYYKNDYNECPVIIGDNVGDNVYYQRKIFPSRMEDPNITGVGMKSGEGTFLRCQTRFGTFSVLICRDFLECLYKLPNNVDIIFCPSYNNYKDGMKRFHKHADDFVTNKPSYIVISNTALYGGTSIFGQLHIDFFSQLIQNKCKEEDDSTYKLCELEEKFEGMIIADFDLINKSPQRQTPSNPENETKSVKNILRRSLENKKE